MFLWPLFVSIGICKWVIVHCDSPAPCCRLLGTGAAAAQNLCCQPGNAGSYMTRESPDYLVVSSLSYVR